MKNKVHLFDIEDAEKYGIKSAVILYNFRYWLDKNKANDQNIHEGRVWTYNSTKAFAEQFPYLSESQVYRCLKGLEDEDILLTGNFNKNSYDRTKWYSVNEDEYSVTESENPHSEDAESILQNRKMENTESKNPSSDTEETIPDSNTDNNPNKKTQREIDALSLDDFDFEEDELECLALHCYQTVKENYPNYDSVTDATLEEWLTPLEALSKKYEVDAEKLAEIWNWGISGWWKDNLTSASKFKEHFEKIDAQYQNRAAKDDNNILDTNGIRQINKTRADTYFDTAQEAISQFNKENGTSYTRNSIAEFEASSNGDNETTRHQTTNPKNNQSHGSSRPQ